MAKTPSISTVDISTKKENNSLVNNYASSSDSIHLSTCSDQFLINKDNISTKSLQIEMNKSNSKRPKKNSDPSPLENISILNESKCAISFNENSKHSFRNDFGKNRMKFVNLDKESISGSDNSLSRKNEANKNILSLLNGRST